MPGGSVEVCMHSHQNRRVGIFARTNDVFKNINSSVAQGSLVAIKTLYVLGNPRMSCNTYRKLL